MKKAILITVAVLAVLGGIAFGAYKMLANSGINILPAGMTLNPNCKYNDPDLCKFINNWKTNKYYTVNSTTTTKDGSTFTSTFKAEGDDKSQVIMAQAGKENFNVITIGNTTYTKDYSDNTWIKTTTQTTDETVAETESEFSFDEKAEKSEDKTTYKKISTEACGNLTCFKYQVIDPANTDSTEYIYFDTKEYQLRKMRSEGNDGTMSESTFDYSKFSITEPSPVKEASANTNTSASGISESDLKALQKAATDAAASANINVDTSDTGVDSSTSVDVDTSSDTSSVEEITE